MHDPSQLLNQAADLHRKGNLAATEALYSELLKAQPANFDALQMFGFLRYDQGRFLEALSLIGEALKTNPHSPTALMNYAVVLDALRRCEEALAYYDKALELKPDYAEALFNRGIALRNLNRPAEALVTFDNLLAITPADVDVLNNRGSTLRSLNRSTEALASYDRALALKPNDADVLNNRGNALQDLERSAEALASYDKAVALRPDHVEALNNRGSSLRSLNRPNEALASYDRALALKPDYAEALYNRGNALQELKRSAEALASYDRALALKPNNANVLNNRGSALQNLKRSAEALASYDKALALKPDHVEALNNRGLTLAGLGRHPEALASFEGALAIKPDHAEALYNRGNALQALKRSAEALASYDRAVALEPNYVEALNNRGLTLAGLGRYAEALANFERAVAIMPDYVEALSNRGAALFDLYRNAEALESFDKVLAIAPDHQNAFEGMAAAALANCDWPRSERIAGELPSRIMERNSAFSPFTLLGYSNDPLLQLECARRIIKGKMPAPTQPLGRGAIAHHDKLRVAYLSADFRMHPVAFLMAELFELHDRARFEILGISFGLNDHSGIRARLIRAFDQFHDVRTKNDHDVARLLNDLHVDIAVDLTGHTHGSRLGILAHRPAPIQVSYMGYPGTIGADFIDYVIVDSIVLPFDQQPYWAEKIVHLPDSYWVIDSNMHISSRLLVRGAVGLPDRAFVFCCFNNNYKITAPVFDVWMRLLRNIEGSVLWLLGADAPATVNLRHEAAARNVDPARLIFADKLPMEEHLARHRLADLFLDTLPYNAHTTASDALWAGLPLVTCRGTSFAGRVAASLLYAAGLPELVTSDLVEYEALALRLATDAELLRGFRHRLEQNRSTHPLFDTDRFRRHIESAYTTMWEIQQRGESPRSFSVEPMT